MKQIFGALAIVGLLLSSGVTAHAQFITVDVPSVHGGTNNLISGVASDHSIYNATLAPSSSQDYDLSGVGSTVTFGTTQQGGGTNTSHDTFSTKDARFTFDLTANGVTQSVQVIGNLKGTTQITGGVGGGNTRFTATSLKLLGNPLFPFLVIDSPNGEPSLELAHVNFNGLFVNVFVEQLNALTVPNANFGNVKDIGGYVIADVPEPGSIALLVGMGIPAAGLLARRRRAR